MLQLRFFSFFSKFSEIFSLLCALVTACPNGTYASGNASGDSTAVCVSCPDANHVTIKVPATSILDCVCASGFTTDGYKCEGNIVYNISYRAFDKPRESSS